MAKKKTKKQKRRDAFRGSGVLTDRDLERLTEPERQAVARRLGETGVLTDSDIKRVARKKKKKK